MTGTILNIQNYAVNDGPGIRTLVFFKGCPMRCTWCCNPESQKFQPQIRYISFRCKACLDCIPDCPHDSVSSSEGQIQRTFEHCDSCQSKQCVEKCNYDAVSISGREISSDDLVKLIARDIPFYRNSGGGVTFSGGEPLAQPEFLLEVLQKCKSLGIHTAIETCGWAGKQAFQQVLPFTDLFLFDLKIIDPAQHLRYTGKEVAPILRNLEFLASEKATIVIRFPLVPGITDSPDKLQAIAGIMNQTGLRHINLEPYHALGTDKYPEHGMDYSLGEMPAYSALQLQSFQNFFSKQDILCEIS